MYKQRGLGTSLLQTAVPVAETAANAIPVVGPFISGGIAIANAIFGGNSNAPAYSSLESSVVNLRLQVAQLSNQFAGTTVDNFSMPFGSSANENSAYAAEIAGSLLNMSPANVKRADLNDAITLLQNNLTNLQSQQASNAASSLSTNSLSSYIPLIVAAGVIIYIVKR